MKEKIVYLHPHFTLPGGAGRFVLETGKRLAERGHEVVVICSRAEEDIIGEFRGKIRFEQIGGPISSEALFWMLFPLWWFKVVAKLAREDRFVLFPQVFPANWWGFLYKTLRPSVRCAWMCQEPSAFIHSRAWINALPEGFLKFCARVLNPMLRWIDTRLARHVDLVLTNSGFCRGSALRVYGYRPELVHVVRLGLDPARFNPGAGRPLKARIMTVGRLSKFKNVHLIIDALAELRRARFPSLQLLIAGRGEEELALKRHAAQCGVDADVFFAGALSDEELKVALQESQCFVLASIDEPFGLVVVEAMACGTPAVVYRGGGPAETVVEHVCGAHFEQPDGKSIASAIAWTIEDEARRRLLGEAAAKQAARFSWDSATDLIEGHLEG